MRNKTHAVEDWMREVIASLPQAEHIDENDFAAWAEALQAMDDFHPVSWHAKRLAGIGGSEAGVAEAQADVDDGVMPDSSRHMPTGLVQDKLVRRLPREPEPAMIRGNRVEEIAAERFLEQTKATRRPDLEAKVGQFSGAVPGHPWMVGNPDLVAEMPDGTIVLADIKAPNDPTRTAEREYVAQLHHYRRIMEAGGVVPDQMMLAKFDYKHFAIITVPVDYDADLERKILRGGDSLWQHVLEGREPDMSHCEVPKPDWESLDEADRTEVRLTIKDAEERLVLEKLAEKAIKADIDTQTDRIREAIGRLGPLRGVKSADLGFELAGFRNMLNVDETGFVEAMRAAGADEAAIDSAYKTKSQYNAEAMAARLAELGENPEVYRERSLDSKKAVEALAAAGIDYAQAFGDVATEKATFTVSKPKKGEPAEIFEAMEDYVNQTIPNMRAALFDPMDNPSSNAEQDTGAAPDPQPLEADETPDEPSRASAVTEQPAESSAESAQSLFDEVMGGAESLFTGASKTNAVAEADNAEQTPDDDPAGDPPAPEPAPSKTPRKDPLESFFPG